MKEIQLSTGALEDLNEGCWFYEIQEAGLGDYFASCLRADIDGPQFFAGIHPVLYLDFHRLLSRVFPYAIYYTFAGKSVTVWAVVDCRRDPAWIRNHLVR